MPISQHTSVGVLRQVLPQPFFLRCSLPAPAQSLRRAIRVERHDMPRSEVVAVISFARRTRLRPPVLKIGGGGRLRILVIPQGWFCPSLEFAPSRTIAILKLGRAPSLISKVTCGKNRPRYLLKELGGSSRSLQVFAPRNVARTHKDERLPVERSLRRRRVNSMLDRRSLSRLRTANRGPRSEQKQRPRCPFDEPMSPRLGRPCLVSIYSCHVF